MKRLRKGDRLKLQQRVLTAWGCTQADMKRAACWGNCCSCFANAGISGKEAGPKIFEVV